MTLAELQERLFIDVPEAAAQVFRVDERTVRRAIADGQIPGVKVGNKTLIPVPKLVALLAAQADGPVSMPPLQPVSGSDAA